jgi:membrane protein required for colicin V production
MISSIFSVVRDFGIIDSVAIIIILFFLVQGFRSGASGEVGCMLAWVLTGLTFYFGSAYIMDEINSFSFLRNNPDAAQFMSFIITLFVSIIIFLVLRRVLTDSISTTVPTPFNEILGTLFGIVKAILLIAFLCIVGLFDPKKGTPHPYVKDSTTIKILQPIITQVLHR